MQAGSTQKRFLFNYDGFWAQLACADGSDIASWSWSSPHEIQGDPRRSEYELVCQDSYPI
jgi:hypothetical protein